MAQNDLASVNLLLMSSPEQRSVDTSTSSEDETPSPATHTLNAFSQPQLRISQLELDAASALMQARCEDPSAIMTDAEEDTRIGGRGSQAATSMAKSGNNGPKDSSDQASSNDSSSDEEDFRKAPQGKGRKRKMTMQRIILQLNAETGECIGRFQSFRAITIATGVHYSTIRNILEGHKASIRGWTFRYEGNNHPPLKRPSLATDKKPAAAKFLPISSSAANHLGDAHSKADSVPLSTKAHPVEQIRIATGAVVAVHRSLTSAEGATGIQRQIISRIVKGELKEHEGWTFRRVDGPPRKTAVPQPPKTVPTTTNPTCDNNDKLIEQIEVATGRVVATHATFTAAGKAVQCRRQLISSIVNGEQPGLVIQGCTFRMSSATTPNLQRPRVGPLTVDTSSAPNKVIEVIKIATGECVGTYPTFTSAGKALGCDRRVVSKIASGVVREYKGCTVRVLFENDQKGTQQAAAGSSGVVPPRNTPIIPSSHVGKEKSSTMKTPKPSPYYPPNYVFIPITIEQTGALGLNVKKVPLTEDLRSALRSYDPQCSATTRDSMRAMSFKKETTLAGRYGIKKWDMLFLAKGESGTETGYDKVAATIRSGNRPLSLVIARDKNQSGRGSPNENADTSNTKHGSSREHDPDSPDQHPEGRSPPARSQNSTQSSSRLVFNQSGNQPTGRRLSFQSNGKSDEKPLMPIVPTLGLSPRQTSPRSKTQQLRLPSIPDAKSPRPLKDESKFLPVDTKLHRPASSTSARTSSKVNGVELVGRQTKAKLDFIKPTNENTNRDCVDCPHKEPKSSTVLGTKQCYSSTKTLDLSSQSSDTSAAPFCLVCNGSGKTNAFHHSWCPKHPSFEKSGATDIYDRIISGRAIGCPVCEKEFLSGRRCKEPHTFKCQALESKKLAKSEQTDEQEVAKELEDVASEPDEETIALDDDELSVYQHRSGQHTGKINKLSLVDENSDATKKQRGKQGERKGTSAKENKTKNKKAVTLSSLKKSIAYGASSKETDSLNKGTRDSSAMPDKDTVTSSVSWKNTANPWGATEHQLDDIIVLSQKRRFAHHDYLMPTPRYAFNPFATDCYIETHKDPLEHGFHVVTLDRDALGSLPWGFSVKRHDFGGACIIATVDPLSPASSASILASGGTLMAPLAVHDIVISIDGNCVGGLSELSVKLLLEASGSSLTVTVARYRHSETVRNQTCFHESNMLMLKDAEISDKRTMDWIDSGVEELKFRDFPTISEQKAILSEDEGKLDLPKYMTEHGFPVSASPSASPNIAEKAKRKKKELLPEVKVASSSRLKSERTGASKDKARSRIQNPKVDNPVPTAIVQASPSYPDPNASTMQDSDDGNAWFNCVCQCTHDDSDPLFWIQCGACCSWYNVARQCIGFSEEQAESVVWICPGCPGDEPQCEDSSILGRQFFSDNMMASYLPVSPTKPFFPDGPNCDGLSCNLDESGGIDIKAETNDRDFSQQTAIVEDEPSKIDTTKGEGDNEKHVESKPDFEVGDRVNVKQHSWAHVNNPSGLAVIRRAYRDEDGDPIYDIKYVIEKVARKAVLPEYLTLSPLGGV